MRCAPVGCVFLALTLVLISCNSEAPITTVEHRVTHVEEVARRSSFDMNDTLPLVQPNGLVVWGDTIIVLDAGEDHLIVHDGALNPTGVIGRPGSGPGEFRNAFGITAWEGGLVVADNGNGRLVQFDRDLELRGTRPAVNPPFQLAVGSDGTAYFPDYLPDHFLTRVDPQGRSSWFGERPEEWELELVGETPQLAINYVAVTSGDTIHVLDNESGRLIKLSPTGDIVMQRTLPFPGRLLDKRPGVAYGGGSAKRLITTPAGMLLALVSDTAVWGLLVDPRDYAAIELRVPGDQPANRYLRSAAMAHYDPPTLVVMTYTDIVRFRITEETVERNE